MRISSFCYVYPVILYSVKLLFKTQRFWRARYCYAADSFTFDSSCTCLGITENALTAHLYGVYIQRRQLSFTSNSLLSKLSNVILKESDILRRKMISPDKWSLEGVTYLFFSYKWPRDYSVSVLNQSNYLQFSFVDRQYPEARHMQAVFRSHWKVNTLNPLKGGSCGRQLAAAARIIPRKHEMGAFAILRSDRVAAQLSVVFRFLSQNYTEITYFNGVQFYIVCSLWAFRSCWTGSER